jgi:iron complex outermembrane receptor protein
MLKRSTVASAALIALGGVLSPAAVAQEVQRVEITGSRILRGDLLGTTPVVSINLDTLANIGAENFADMATQLPQFAPSFGTSRTQSTFSGVGTSGLNLANLRNLGSVRSLVLINGRRAAGVLRRQPPLTSTTSRPPTSSASRSSPAVRQRSTGRTLSRG